MKAKLICYNWCLSFFGLSIDPDKSSFWLVLIMIIWFCASSLLLRYADKKGWLKKIINDK